MRHGIEQNGVVIARTPTGIAVGWSSYPPPVTNRPVLVEIDYRGRRIYERFLDPLNDMPYRDYFGGGCDHLGMIVRVKDGQTTLAELGVSDDRTCLPFMVRQGEQRHITENYVSVPPALTITDEVGAVWTLGFKPAPRELSPEGEFAFNVLRDGFDMGEVASRIERRSGKVRILTCHGWKRWLGREFS